MSYRGQRTRKSRKLGPRKHLLLTQELRKKIPKLYSAEKEKDPIVHTKFFDAGGSWTWYVLEFDGKDTFFGLVKGFETELGYFSLHELETTPGKLGIPIERDKYWKPIRLSELRRKLSEEGWA